MESPLTLQEENGSEQNAAVSNISSVDYIQQSQLWLALLTVRQQHMETSA